MRLPACLLAVDLQAGFISGQTDWVPAAVRRFCDSHPVEHRVFTRFLNPGGRGSFERVLGWAEMAGGPDVELASEVAGLPTMTVDKHAYSPFLHTPLEGHLRSLGADEVMVCGVDTDACVLAAAVGLFDRGFRPVVLADLCASGGGRRLHADGLRILARQIGESNVVTGAELPGRFPDGADSGRG